MSQIPENIQKALQEGAEQGKVLRRYFQDKKEVATAFMLMSLSIDTNLMPAPYVTKMFECFSAIYEHQTNHDKDWVGKNNFFFRHTWSIIGKCLQETWGSGIPAKEAKNTIMEHLMDAFIFALLNEMEKVDMIGCLKNNFIPFATEYMLGSVEDIPSGLQIYDQLEGIAGVTIVEDRTNASIFSIVVRMLDEHPMVFLDKVIDYVQ